MVIQVRGCWKILCLIHRVLTLVIMMTKYIEPLHWVLLWINKVYYCLGLPHVIKSVGWGFFNENIGLGHLFLCEIKFSESAVFILQWFLLQGALISLCDDDYVHLWNLRQAHPALVQSLRFNREKWVWLLYFSNIYIVIKQEWPAFAQSDDISVRKYGREMWCKRSSSGSKNLISCTTLRRLKNYISSISLLSGFN